MGDLLLHIIYLCTIGLSLYTSSWLLLKADRNDTTGALAACQILVMIWCIPQLFAGAADAYCAVRDFSRELFHVSVQ